LCIETAIDGTVYLDRIIRAATSGRERGVDGGSPADAWKSVLILIPLRLGLGTRMDAAYHSTLRACLSMPESVGCVGGRPGGSLYFVGHHDFDRNASSSSSSSSSSTSSAPNSPAAARSPSGSDDHSDASELLFLDPHSVQAGVPLQTDFLSLASAPASPHMPKPCHTEPPPELTLASPSQQSRLSSVVAAAALTAPSQLLAAPSAVLGRVSVAVAAASAANARSIHATHAASYHCATVRAMRCADLDPSMALGFYCRTEAELVLWWARVSALRDQAEDGGATSAASATAAGSDSWADTGSGNRPRRAPLFSIAERQPHASTPQSQFPRSASESAAGAAAAADVEPASSSDEEDDDFVLI
jgi:cysteine protease ATG4